MNIRPIKNVSLLDFGDGSITLLPEILERYKTKYNIVDKDFIIAYFIDAFFDEKIELLKLPKNNYKNNYNFVDTKVEPKTSDVDSIVELFRSNGYGSPSLIICIGGGITLDTGKAVANMLTNEGNAEKYQGWDLVKNPAIYKIGIPTISGTGSEATRTCVMTNTKSGLKLGMNSDYTVFDHIILDPGLTKSVEHNQFFYTGIDTYIHCFEALSGNYRNLIGDAFSLQAIEYCREVFMSDDMKSDQMRERLMVASYLGGCSIAASYVGLVHPFSAALSVVLGIHHGLANCITMRAMQPYYPKYYEDFFSFVNTQKIYIPEGVCRNLPKAKYNELINATIIHEKPLTNALGPNFRSKLDNKTITKIFKTM